MHDTPYGIMQAPVTSSAQMKNKFRPNKRNIIFGYLKC